MLETSVATGKGKHAKHKAELGGFVLVFDEALDGASAESTANYQVLEAVKKGKKITEKPIAFQVSYNAATDSVDLTVSGNPAFTDGGELIVNTSGISGQAGGTGAGSTTYTIAARAKGIGASS